MFQSGAMRMKRYSKMILAAMTAAALASGCASTPKAPEAAQAAPLPDWVMNPTVEGGIASAECVRDTGNFSLDRAESTAKARASLVKEIDVRVQAMDKTYMRSVSAGDE